MVSHLHEREMTLPVSSSCLILSGFFFLLFLWTAAWGRSGAQCLECPEKCPIASQRLEIVISGSRIGNRPSTRPSPTQDYSSSRWDGSVTLQTIKSTLSLVWMVWRLLLWATRTKQETAIESLVRFPIFFFLEAAINQWEFLLQTLLERKRWIYGLCLSFLKMKSSFWWTSCRISFSSKRETDSHSSMSRPAPMERESAGRNKELWESREMS